MVEIEYGKIRSFHIIRTWTRVPGRWLALCGRVGTSETTDSFGDEKTCETCFRISVKEHTHG